MKKMFLCGAAAMFFWLLSPISPAQAYQSEIVKDASGKAVFEVRFYGKNERYMNKKTAEETGEVSGVSTWTINKRQRAVILEAASLWADVLGEKSSLEKPAVIKVGTFNGNNAFGASLPNKGEKEGKTALARSLQTGMTKSGPGYIVFGKLDMESQALSSLPQGGKMLLSPTLYHEIAHALGITSWVSGNEEGEPLEELSEMDGHLYDMYGTRLTKGSLAMHADTTDKRGAPYFVFDDESQSGVVYKGSHVSQVLDGALNDSLRIEGWEDTDPDLSHIELERSLMSHQAYRSYNAFMEAELALLQDLGYRFDRKRFFGRSIYGSFLTVTNDVPYYARSKGGWLWGRASQERLGVGLHIYGRRNDVTQKADLLAGGEASVAARIDGSDNTLRIPAGTTLAADGKNGTGLLAAYGRNHKIINAGKITAKGQNGVAARFDFGTNMLGADEEYRGSWIRLVGGVSRSVTAGDDGSGCDENGYALNLAGPLVKRFDVSGTLQGTKAILISANAYVENINIMAGASLSGDIVSNWDPGHNYVQKKGLYTALTFGLKKGPVGWASQTADPDFLMDYGGSITGAGINMHLAGGKLVLGGETQLHSLRNSGHLKLTGTEKDRHYAMSFTNDSDAVLETEFNAGGESSRISAVLATLDGTRIMTPLKDFYPSGKVIKPLFPVDASLTDGSFSRVKIGSYASPTISFDFVDDDPMSASVTVKRPDDAYSRYALDSGTASLGRALAGAAGNAGMAGILAEIDFGPADGSGVSEALAALYPDLYSAAIRESLRRQSWLNTVLFDRMANWTPHAEGTGWRPWISPFYGRDAREGADGTAGWRTNRMGMFAGADYGFDSGSLLGFNLAFSSSGLTRRGGSCGTVEDRGVSVGLHAAYSPQGTGFWAGFSLRAGAEDAETVRKVRFGDYAASHTADYMAYTGSAMLGGGYDFRLTGLSLGPVAWLEYSSLWRRGFSENGPDGLSFPAERYDDLLLAMGGRIKKEFAWGKGKGGISLLGAWQRSLSGGLLTTKASFPGGTTFPADSRFVDRNALLLKGELSYQAENLGFASLSAGSSLRDHSTEFNMGLTFGKKF